MDSHSQTQSDVAFYRTRNLQGTVGRCFKAIIENKHHSITRGKTNKFVGCLRLAKLFRSAHDLVELSHQLALLIDGEHRVANDVDYQDVPNL